MVMMSWLTQAMVAYIISETRLLGLFNLTPFFFYQNCEIILDLHGFPKNVNAVHELHMKFEPR